MFKANFKLQSKVLIPFVFFFSFYCLGLSIYKDYGVSWDEHTERVTGVVSALYINGKLGNVFLSEEAIQQKLNLQRQQTSVFLKESKEEVESKAVKFDKDALKEYYNKDYGVAFQLILTAAEAVTGFSDTRDVYFLRHLLTFSFFFICTIFFYFLSIEILKKWHWALLSVVLLLLSPRIFAHSFYNSKDLVFMGAFMMASYTLLKLIQKQSFQNILLHALFTAFLIGIRVPGMIIIAITLLFLFLNFFQENTPKKKYYKVAIYTVMYILITFVFTVMLWPTLWENPFYILESFGNMSKFRWGGHVMYLGELEKATNLPWHYIIVWIGVSTPLLIIAFFIYSSISFLAFLIKGKTIFFKNRQEQGIWLAFALFFVPLLALIVLKPVLYGAWRHVFFIYPALVLVSVIGFKDFSDVLIQKLKNKKLITIGMSALITLSLLPTLSFMIRNHPYQNLYFNILAGSEIEGRFDRDYWGLSYREALERLLELEPLGEIKIFADVGSPANLNAMILTQSQRSRIQFVSLEEADYYITTDATTEMLGNDPKVFYQKEYGLGSQDEIESITVDDIKIHKIYKLP